ncbi:MAG: hypothetical protein K5681_04110 [Treponema sp.]|nr:hypothetical protein [Treponema sp.]
MPISTKTKTSLLTPDFKNQIANNGKLDTPVEPSVPESPAITPTVKAEPKSKYNDVANLHFSRGKKAEFKAFFSSHEVTLVQGVENAVNYIMKEVKAGRLTVSRNGIEKVGE